MDGCQEQKNLEEDINGDLDLAWDFELLMMMMNIELLNISSDANS